MAILGSSTLSLRNVGPGEGGAAVEESSTRADTGRDATDKSSGAQSILRRLLEEGYTAVESGSGIDAAWTATAASVLVRAIADGEPDVLAQAQGGLRRLAALARLAAKRDDPPARDGVADRGVSADANSVTLDQTPSIGSFHKLEALLEVTDAAAGLLRPRGLVAQPEWGTLQAKIVLALTPDRATPNEEIRDVVQCGSTQLSRAFKNLVDQGLVRRRSYGRKVAWILTTAGQEAASAVRELAPTAATVGNINAVEVVATDEEVLSEGLVVRSPQALREAIASAVRNLWIDPTHLTPGTGKGSLARGTLYHRVDEALTLDADNWIDEWHQSWFRKSDAPTMLVAPASNTYYIKINKMPSGNSGSTTKPNLIYTPSGEPMDGPVGESAEPGDPYWTTGDLVQVAEGISTKVRHVMPNPDGGWDVVAPKAVRSSAHAPTQSEAIKRAHEIVRNAGGGEVVIHGRDGRVRDSNPVRSRRQST